MIRINLLESSASPAVPRRWFDRSWWQASAGIAMALTAALTIGWQLWSLRAEVAGVEEALALATEDLTRLAPVLQEVARAEADRDRWRALVAAVGEINGHRRHPAELLEAVSAAVPDGVWLSHLSQGTEGVTIRGHAFALDGVLQFVVNLEVSRPFGAPVALVGSRFERTDQGEIVGFELHATPVDADAADR